MFGVVVKVKIWLEFRQKLALVEPPQEHRLIDVNAPMHQGADRTFVGGRAPRRDQGDPDPHAFGRAAFGPQAMEGLKKRFEWPRVEGLIRSLRLMALERIQPLGLEYTLRLV